MLRSDFAEGLTQFPDFAEFPAEFETGEAPVHVFNPVTRKIFTRPELHRRANNRSVHDQVSKSGWVRGAKCRPTGISSQEETSPNSSPNCAPKRLQIVLFAPLYSFEIIGFPGFTIPLLLRN